MEDSWTTGLVLIGFGIGFPLMDVLEFLLFGDRPSWLDWDWDDYKKSLYAKAMLSSFTAGVVLTTVSITVKAVNMV